MEQISVTLTAKFLHKEEQEHEFKTLYGLIDFILSNATIEESEHEPIIKRLFPHAHIVDINAGHW
jgi:hypothetical protein